MASQSTRRWNGWGEKTYEISLPSRARTLLEENLGAGFSQPDCSLEKLLRKIPKSRLPFHPLIHEEPQRRLDHSHGQSLPDWVSLRSGTLDRFVDGVAYPETISEIENLLEYARKTGAVVIPHGGGTSVAGHLAVPEGVSPVLSLSLERFNKMVSMDSESLLATFQAGISGPAIEKELNRRGFTLGHFPQSFEYSTLGGWVATRSAGQQSLKYGRIERLFAGAEMVTPEGGIHFSPVPASAAGPDLRQICLGSEGRMGIIAHVTVRVSPLPEKEIFYGAFFPDWERACKALRELAISNVTLSMARLSNELETRVNLALAGHSAPMKILKKYLEFRKLAEERMCMCLLGFTGTRRQVGCATKEAFSVIARHEAVRVGTPMGTAWKKNRFKAPYLRNTLWDMGYAADTLETAVTWDRVTPTMRRIEKSIVDSMRQMGHRAVVFSHLSHIYPTGSSIYTTFVFRIGKNPEGTLCRWRRMKEAASLSIVNAGGTISHQHGVGIDHAPYLLTEKGQIGVQLIRSIFSGLDPSGMMNPGKLVCSQGEREK